MYRGVVFDMDGVLTDTERAWLALFEDLAASLGKELSDQDRFELFGCSDAVENVVMARAFAMGEDEVRRLKESWTEAHPIAYGANALAPMIALVPWLRERGLLVAVASSSKRENVERMMDETGTRGLFDAVVAGDEVVEAKPSPDVYLKAAAHLGQDPARLLAVEDSVVGVEAAAAAGMDVVQLSREERLDAPRELLAARGRTAQEAADKIRALVEG